MKRPWSIRNNSDDATDMIARKSSSSARAHNKAASCWSLKHEVADLHLSSSDRVEQHLRASRIKCETI